MSFFSSPFSCYSELYLGTSKLYSMRPLKNAVYYTVVTKIKEKLKDVENKTKN